MKEARHIRTAKRIPDFRVRQLHEWFGALDAALEADEDVRYVCVADKDFVTGLLAVSESRLLWVDKKTRSSLMVSSISSITSEAGGVRSHVARLVVDSVGTKHEFSEIESACANDVVSLIGGQARSVQVPESVVPEPRPLPELKIDGVIAVIGVFIAGAIAIVPRLLGYEDLPIIAWPIAACTLFVASFYSGLAVQAFFRALLGSKRRGHPPGNERP